MQKRTKITMASAIVGALATSALVAGAAFATTPPVVTAPSKTATVSVVADKDNVNFESTSQADDATEVQTPEKSEKAGVGSEKAGPAEADGIDHQFNGQETGNNGVGVDAPGSSSK